MSNPYEQVVTSIGTSMEHLDTAHEESSKLKHHEGIAYDCLGSALRNIQKAIKDLGRFKTNNDIVRTTTSTIQRELMSAQTALVPTGLGQSDSGVTANVHGSNLVYGARDAAIKARDIQECYSGLGETIHDELIAAVGSVATTLEQARTQMDGGRTPVLDLKDTIKQSLQHGHTYLKGIQ